MELQGLTRRSGTLLTASAAALALLCGTALGRGARHQTVASPTSSSDTPVQVSSLNARPRGYRLTAANAERIAAAYPVARAELRRHPRARPYEYTKGPGLWQVSWFSRGRELLQVYVQDRSGEVTEAWTGFQVAWTMARGYPGAFGRRANAWYIWISLCLLFIAPFLPRPRRGRITRWGWSLFHLDLLALLGFSISLALFNHGEIGLSVPLVYPFLIYLLGRMLLVACGRGRPQRPLRLIVPVSWLSVAVIFLVGFRIGLNLVNSNVIDVGYAGVIGADKLVHGQSLYGGWPAGNANGDTYGPVTYYAYVPFRSVFGWSGRWDDLPAAHAAAILFDLLTLLALFLLGRRIRGPTLGTVLAYAWAAFPFTLWTLSSNTNDALVALLIVTSLLAIASPVGRGVVGALAALTKFAPLALAPLLARGIDRPIRLRRLALSGGVYVAMLGVVMLPVLLDHNLHAFWRDTIAYQSDRVTPFSVWGLWGGLSTEQHLLEGMVIGLALGAALLPRRRDVAEVAALAAAILIALQLVAGYWLYTYVVWFAPLVLVALLAGGRSTDAEPMRVSGHREPLGAPARSTRPASVLGP